MSAVKKRYQVFVSSTFEDLKEERQEVIQALLELDCIPCGMELFPAANESQWQLIKRMIDDCDYYIVIVAGRYGSRGPQGQSFTEMEYRYALERNKPTLAFLHESPDELPAKHCEPDPDRKRQLHEFRKLLDQKLSRRWKAAADLGSKVSRSLLNLIRDYPSAGWVRADQRAEDDIESEVRKLRSKLAEFESGRDEDRVMPWSIYWDQLRRISERVRRIYSDGRYLPKVIVSISNGGGIFGELLARQFTGIPLAMLWADRQNKNGDYFDNEYNKGVVKAIRKTVSLEKEMDVLVVDDIIASGYTHARAFKFLRAHVPNAALRFLPMFSRNEKYFEVVCDDILWTHPAFGLSVVEAHKLHETGWMRLPYQKDIRSS